MVSSRRRSLLSLFVHHDYQQKTFIRILICQVIQSFSHLQKTTTFNSYRLDEAIRRLVMVETLPRLKTRDSQIVQIRTF